MIFSADANAGRPHEALSANRRQHRVVFARTFTMIDKCVDNA
jgi:hypothetical protein